MNYSKNNIKIMKLNVILISKSWTNVSMDILDKTECLPRQTM